MSGKSPPQQPDWSNLSVIHRNTLPPRSHFFIYDTESAALSRDSASSERTIKLSGSQWLFHHAFSPISAPSGFEEPGYDSSSWARIDVPSMWQLQGYGRPHYTNVNYPFPVDPPNVPFDENQTGSYIRKFVLPERFKGEHLRLRFEGVDSAFHVWINGIEVGYSQGSRNPSEFDVTGHVKLEEENTLAVRVYQWCDGSYIEDQDQWWLSGIFRDVYLLAFPEFRVEDFHLLTHLDEKYRDADLEVKLNIHGKGEIMVKVLDASGTAIAGVAQSVDPGTSSMAIPILSPQKWTAETANLYTVVMSFGSSFIAQRFGFRKIEINDGIYTINGQRIVFRGANRHEHHPRLGRTVPYDWMKQDLLLMKRHNINALRTCHQPSHPDVYDLADELGLYIMDEADLECHGFATIEEAKLSREEKDLPFNEQQRLVYDRASKYTSDNPAWEAAYVDRAVQLVQRDKNHASVVMWSLGNEAFYGSNHQKMYDAIKAVDTSRPIHYEQDWDAKTVDVYSRMYMSANDCVSFVTGQLKSEPGSGDTTKPLILCEFVHAMGNGPGNIMEYVQAFYEYRRFQGGWIWEWANHGLLTKNEHGQEFYAYGGDFGDVPNDGNFVMDGVLFSDHTPTPGLIEYAKAIEPVQLLKGLDGSKIGVEVHNRYDIITLDHLVCNGSIVSDDMYQPLDEMVIPLGVKPHAKTMIEGPEFDAKGLTGEVFLNLDFSLKNATLWADKGHVVARSQVRIKAADATQVKVVSSIQDPSPVASWTNNALTLSTSTSTLVFSLVTGTLTSWTKSSCEMIMPGSGPVLSFSRAQTDNDRPQDGKTWDAYMLNLTKPHCKKVSWITNNSLRTVVVTVEARVAPPVLAWSISTTTTYTFSSDGSLRMKVSGTPSEDCPPTVARIGLTMCMPEQFHYISWFGRGPGESYRDKKESQRIGNYQNTVNGLWTEYEFPQEGSNRTDVRWVKISNSKSDSNGGEESAMTASSSSVEPSTTSALNTFTSSLISALKPTTTPMTLTARFPPNQPGNFMISHYTIEDIETAKHPFELHKMKRKEVVVRLDWVHHGLGTGSCGPKTLDQYALKMEKFEYEIVLE